MGDVSFSFERYSLQQNWNFTLLVFHYLGVSAFSMSNSSQSNTFFFLKFLPFSRHEGEVFGFLLNILGRARALSLI